MFNPDCVIHGWETIANVGTSNPNSAKETAPHFDREEHTKIIEKEQLTMRTLTGSTLPKVLTNPTSEKNLCQFESQTVGKMTTETGNVVLLSQSTFLPSESPHYNTLRGNINNSPVTCDTMRCRGHHAIQNLSCIHRPNNNEEAMVLDLGENRNQDCLTKPNVFVTEYMQTGLDVRSGPSQRQTFPIQTPVRNEPQEVGMTQCSSSVNRSGAHVIPVVPMGCALNQYFSMEHSITEDLSTPMDCQIRGFEKTVLVPDHISMAPLDQSNLQPSQHRHFVAVNPRANPTRYCCHKIILLFICALIIICVSYRLIDWFNRYKAMRNYFVYTRDDSAGSAVNNQHQTQQWPNEPRLDNLGVSQLVITLCNLNPLQGTSLLAVKNGSILYDLLLHRRQRDLFDPIHMNSLQSMESESQSTQENRNHPPSLIELMSTELLNRAGHQMDQMLKNCIIREKTCNARNFTTILSVYGLCHMLPLQYDGREVHFLLDPQEYDYLIPNHGLTGFRVFFHTSEALARLQLQKQQHQPDRPTFLHFTNGQPIEGVRSNEALVGTEFNTIIRVSVGVMESRLRQSRVGACSGSSPCATGKTASPHIQSSHSTKREAVQPNPPTNPSPPSYFPNWLQSTAQIVSTTQVPKPRQMYSLMRLRHPKLFHRNPLVVAWALRIQQRAYLQLANKTAFNQLHRLVVGFSELQTELLKTTTHLKRIRRNLWSDERDLLQQRTSNEHCIIEILQYIRLLDNITSTFQQDLCDLHNSDSLHTTPTGDCHKSQSAPLKGSSSREGISENQDLARATILVQGISATDDVTADEDQWSKFDVPIHSRPILKELKLIDMFFTQTLSNPELKDILRNYLRSLSAKRMQLQPRPGESASQRENNVNEDSGTRVQSDRLSSGPCDSRSTWQRNEKYHHLLLELGESIAASLQRLDVFRASMDSIVQANQHVIAGLEFPRHNLSTSSLSSLVSFTVQLETVGVGNIGPRLISLDQVMNPFDEILSIMFTTLSLLVPMLFLSYHGLCHRCHGSRSNSVNSVA